jgi:hypothetical protein
MRGRHPNSHREGGPTVNPGRTGAAWRRCRARVIERAAGTCAICEEWVDPDAPRFSPGEGHVDHYPLPLHKLKELHGEGTPEYTAAANDPDGCRLVHRQCHEDRDVIPSAVDQPARARSPEADSLDGVYTGPAHVLTTDDVRNRSMTDDAEWHRLLDGYADRPNMWHGLLVRRGCPTHEADDIITRRLAQ